MFERLLVTLLYHSKASPGQNSGASHPDWLGPPLPRRNNPYQSTPHMSTTPHRLHSYLAISPPPPKTTTVSPRVFSVQISHSLRLRASLRAHFASCPGVASGFFSGFPSGAVRTQNFTSSFLLLLLFQPALLPSPLSPFHCCPTEAGRTNGGKKRQN